MQVTILIAALIIVMATGPAQAGLISSVVPSSETSLGATLDAVVDTTVVTADTTVGTTVETTPEATEEATSDSTATVWVPPPGLLSDGTIASIGAELGADTAIGTVDLNTNLNIGLNVNEIPEPGTILLVGVGLAALITTARQKARKRQVTLGRENL